MALTMQRNGPSRIYESQGNRPLIEMLEPKPARILDIGCGSGGNASLLQDRCSSSEIVGVTYSAKEAEIARSYMSHVWVLDLEGDLPTELLSQRFDVLICSHILEHLRDPAFILARLVTMLREGGQVLIAVPNVLSWRMRVQFLFGNFEYQSGGVLDDTHLRFFTYNTADSLLSQSPDLYLEYKGVSGGVPLWLLRRYLLSGKWCRYIDHYGCRKWPNLFGNQILISAIKSKEA
ncbi:class I SAM-dependent methyltransferase [Acidithiobacillus ferrooxidans]|uniref:class I SAM-dependent methyltransferase n=1 Tax=Acidithiobacillus ferrooxidans TaxID=920 RepID=UPI0013D71F33|nr:class I SAM-dependent methyltransferase [Acidithiobacillus ferrooxidans]MBU2856622.1 class I SAM-dependent methyltransferase [Acidithiobacillus ferrooxidans]MCR2830701.1 class I SAM-dependent methyltransferase [Acidithiobacillus ferrooxidans]